MKSLHAYAAAAAVVSLGCSDKLTNPSGLRLDARATKFLPPQGAAYARPTDDFSPCALVVPVR